MDRDVERLHGEDLTFWWLDSPQQPTTMAMLMLLDRAPQPDRLRAAVLRSVAAVPRLAQRVREAPLDLTLPHWERDPTFDLDYHVRHHAVAGGGDWEELLREIGPAYETPFDRSRPLWEARIYQGLRGDRAAMFFKLHHAVADGVGGNAIFAAMTDWDRDGVADAGLAAEAEAKGTWGAPAGWGGQVLAAIRDRVELDLERAGAAARAVADTLQHPGQLRRALGALRALGETMRFDSHSPLKEGRGAPSGMALPFAEVRALKAALGGTMIDVICTIMALAMSSWHRAHQIREVSELMTLVPISLRKPEEWTRKAATGNVATGIMVRLPIALRDPLATFREVRARVEAAKADPSANASPVIAEAMSLLPRALVTWLTESTFGSIDFIVTNVPGILVPRYLAGAEILAAYPFAPVAMRSPASVALYGYRDALYIGLTSDEALMPDVTRFEVEIQRAFRALQTAAGTAAAPAVPTRRRAPAKHASTRRRGRV
ncbi:MAG: wax ester/triacylglycerol synthase family O-acyltransferase [Candidatus Binatia bacterium]